LLVIMKTTSSINNFCVITRRMSKKKIGKKKEKEKRKEKEKEKKRKERKKERALKKRK